APAQAAGTIDVTVTTPSGTSATGTADHFTFSAASAPTVTGLTPTSGSTAGGTVMYVSGTNFLGASDVKFGSLPAVSFSVLSATLLTAVAPAQAASVIDITVTTPSGTSATGSADHFTYVAATAPAVQNRTVTTGST